MMRSPAIVAALAIGLAATFALAAPAAQAAPSAQTTVKLGDLDLSSAAGAHAALGRLTRAAAKVCGEQPNTNANLIRQSDTFWRCRSEAVAAAVVQLPGAAIATAYAESRGRTLQLAGR
jgi:UrcA family protein